MVTYNAWDKFVRDVTAWQAASRHGPLGLSTDPEDYVRTPEAAVVLQWHEEGVCGGSCQFCFVPPRCPSTPPPFKYESQQCDRPLGHAGPHWFDDGWFIHKWTEPHMAWCGLDTDHQGMCHPAHPDHGEKGQPEEPVRCSRRRDHSGGHRHHPEVTGGLNQCGHLFTQVDEDEGYEGQCSTEISPEAPEASPEALLRQGAVVVLKEILRAVTALLEEVEEIECQ